MGETIIILWATAVALFMASLNAQNATPDLLAAIRTTIVVIMGWSFSCYRFGFIPWSKMLWPLRLMLVISGLAVILSWLLHLQAARKPPVSGTAVMDRANVGIAVLMALLLLWQQTSTQMAMIGFCLVCGTLFLAFGKR